MAGRAEGRQRAVRRRLRVGAGEGRRGARGRVATVGAVANSFILAPLAAGNAGDCCDADREMRSVIHRFIPHFWRLSSVGRRDWESAGSSHGERQRGSILR
jgi:hypothetical protein